MGPSIRYLLIIHSVYGKRKNHRMLPLRKIPIDGVGHHVYDGSILLLIFDLSKELDCCVLGGKRQPVTLP